MTSADDKMQISTHSSGNDAYKTADQNNASPHDRGGPILLSCLFRENSLYLSEIGSPVDADLKKYKSNGLKIIREPKIHEKHYSPNDVDGKIVNDVEQSQTST